MSPKPERLAVVLEAGDKKVFASAADWPGWSRSGKTDEAAIEALRHLRAALRARGEARGARAARVDRGRRRRAQRGRLRHRLRRPEPGHRAPTPARSRRPTPTRLAAIVEAAWTTFDRVAAGAPAELRKGPRGGGRDRDKMVGHVVECRLVLRPRDRPQGRGSRIRPTAPRSRRCAPRCSTVLRQPSDGRPLAGRKWTARYAAHRIAWHALDHAWEMEDRSEREEERDGPRRGDRAAQHDRDRVRCQQDLDGIMAHVRGRRHIRRPAGQRAVGRPCLADGGCHPRNVRVAHLAASGSPGHPIPGARRLRHDGWTAEPRGGPCHGSTSDAELFEGRGIDLWNCRDGRVVKKDSYWKIR